MFQFYKNFIKKWTKFIIKPFGVCYNKGNKDCFAICRTDRNGCYIMKIVKKVKLIFLPAIILPLLLMVIATVTICNVYMNATYNKKFNGINSVANPTQAMNGLTSDIYLEMKLTSETQPERFEDVEYLNGINKQLFENFSYLIVRKGDNIVYRGTNENHDDIESLLPEYGGISSSIDGGLFISHPENFLIKQNDFAYQDGSEGSAFIMTYMGDIIPKFKNILLQIIIAILGILIFSSTLVSAFMYTEFIRPIRLLKDGTDRIKEGDLESDVEVINNDEIGELCDSFNEMRVKLKLSIDDRLRYEEENRELISNISHDLKTPITAIKGYVEGIMDGVADTPKKMEKYIRTIYNKATDMDVLINELAVYSKIDCNIFPYNFTKIDIDAYFSDCIEEISVDLEAKGIAMTYFNYCNPHQLVVADPEQIKRVINNIVINASKYNDKQRGHVNIRLREQDGYVQVEIEDNGKGISDTDLPNIFNRLYRADSSRNSTKGGSGLGLSIAKKIIDEHGGKIWATSKEDTGTVVYFTLRKYKEELLDE